jgi:hypothetical protein
VAQSRATVARPAPWRGLPDSGPARPGSASSKALESAIFPQGLSHVDQRRAAVERRVLHQLRCCVAMASLRAADVAGSGMAERFPPGRTLLRDDVDDGVGPAAFQHRLWGPFTVSDPRTLTLPQRDRIRWHLFPELRLRPQATLDFGPAWPAAPSLHDLMDVMDLQQEQGARTLGEGHRVIHGAAGSGRP